MRTGLTVKIVILVILLLAVVFLLIAGIGMGTDIFNFGNHFEVPNFNITSTGNHPNAIVIEDGSKEFEVDGIDAIDVDWISGSATVIPYDGDTIKVTESSRVAIPDNQRMSYEILNGRLSIYFSPPKTSFISNAVDKDLDVLVPQDMKLSHLEVDGASSNQTVKDINTLDLDVESLSGWIEVKGDYDQADVDSTSGEITVDGAFGELQIETLSGNTELTGKSDLLDVDSTSGTITVNGTFGQFNCEALSGETELTGKFDTLNVETTSGEIVIAGPIGQLDIESISGDVKLTLPEDSEFTLETETISGSIMLDFASKMHNDEYIVGNGEKLYRVETTSGDIDVLSAA